MRRGWVFRRCTKCNATLTLRGRKCPTCGSLDQYTWAFRVDISEGGRRRQRRGQGFLTRDKALEAMARVQVASADGTYVEPSRMTTGEYLQRWVDGGCGGVRPGTLRGYEVVVRIHLKPRIGAIPLQKLGRSDIRTLYAELARTGFARKARQQGGPLSAKSVWNVHICLRAALNDAVEDGTLRSNPAQGALKPPKGRRRMETWTVEELRAFLDSVRADRNFTLYRLAAQTGMRRGELLGLTWRDVHLDAGYVSVQTQLGDDDDEVDAAPTKSDAGRRSISIKHDLQTVEALREHRRAQQFERRGWGELYRDHGLVFCRPDGTPHDPDTISGQFDRLLKAAYVETPDASGVQEAMERTPVRRIRFHDLRHTHATLLLEAGVDVTVVSKRLGHASVKTTADLYVHVTDRLQQDASARIGALLDPSAASRARTVPEGPTEGPAEVVEGA